jgi:hypothetical protein
MATLAAVRGPFRALVMTIVPEASRLDSAGWTGIEGLAEDLLADRPPRLRAGLRWFVRLLNWAPAVRYGRSLTRLDPEQRRRFLARVQDSPLRVVRVGFWGLRTVILAAYYGRETAGGDIGYRADRRGWEARR